MHVRIKILLTLICLFCSISAFAAEVAAKVAAAANLKFPLEEIAKSFHQDTGKNVTLIFGSSGTLATQIMHGAPFELYLSADHAHVALLHDKDLTQGKGVLYAQGRLAIMAPLKSPLKVDSNLRGLTELLKSGKLQRFAIANPQHAPYGQQAEMVLHKLGLWQAIQQQLVYGENVSQATQFALSGSADGGIVALSSILSPAMANRLRYAEIDSGLYEPLQQHMVLLNSAGTVAKDFYAYLQQPAARAIFMHYGFAVPETDQ